MLEAVVGKLFFHKFNFFVFELFVLLSDFLPGMV
jgi:hypothetical protein